MSDIDSSSSTQAAAASPPAARKTKRAAAPGCKEINFSRYIVRTVTQQAGTHKQLAHIGAGFDGTAKGTKLLDYLLAELLEAVTERARHNMKMEGKVTLSEKNMQAAIARLLPKDQPSTAKTLKFVAKTCAKYERVRQEEAAKTAK